MRSIADKNLEKMNGREGFLSYLIRSDQTVSETPNEIPFLCDDYGEILKFTEFLDDRRYRGVFLLESIKQRKERIVGTRFAGDTPEEAKESIEESVRMYNRIKE